MSEVKSAEKEVKVTKKAFIVTEIGALDSVLAVSDTLEEAIKLGIEDVDGNEEPAVVYECKAVRVLRPGKVTVETVK